MISSQIDPPFRVVTIGEASVGKTSITNRLIEDLFNPYEPGTIGANYQPYITVIDGQKVEIQIWDTAGQEKFKSLTPIYFRNSSAAVAVFSLTSRASFEGLDEWITNFTETAGFSALVFIAANKCDCVDDIEVPVEEAKAWAQERNYFFFMTSAKTGEGIQEMFNCLAKELQATKNKKEETVRTPVKAQQEGSGGGCC